MSNYPKSSNPFLDDEEEEGDNFYPSNKSHGNEGYGYGGPYDDRRRQKQELVYASEDRQLESSRRALASLYDSERMGVATAEELVRQGEQLDNVEGKLGDINQSMKTSQKHINNIKSVFGGIKNWWQGKKKEEDDLNKIPEARESKLKSTVENRKQTPAGEQSALKLKSDDVKGFYEEDDDLDQRFMAGSKNNYNTQQMFQPVTRSAREEQLNENLGELSDGVSRLKDLALGLGDEIEVQNAQIDRINPKMDTLNDRMENQNKQMKVILRK